MTEPSQYFKGRTVQEQMNEVIGYVDVRSAEVAVDAIAADVAQVHQDMLDADADAAAAAASAAAAAGTLANAVKKTGESSQSIAGDIAISGNLSASGTTQLVDVVVSNTIEVPTPTTNVDAANKMYVDDADALKVSIANINQYAVGLTGNQGPIAGKKTFSEGIDAILEQKYFGATSTDKANYWFKVCTIDASIASVFCSRFMIHTNNTQYSDFVATNSGIFGNTKANVDAYKVKPIIVVKSNGSRELWCQIPRTNGYGYCICLGLSRTVTSYGMNVITFSSDVSQSDKPAVGGDITNVYDMVEI